MCKAALAIAGGGLITTTYKFTIQHCHHSKQNIQQKYMNNYI